MFVKDVTCPVYLSVAPTFTVSDTHAGNPMPPRTPSFPVETARRVMAAVVGAETGMPGLLILEHGVAGLHPAVDHCDPLSAPSGVLPDLLGIGAPVPPAVLTFKAMGMPMLAFTR